MNARSRGLTWTHIALIASVVSLTAFLIGSVQDLRGQQFTILPKPYAASLCFALAAVLGIFYLWYFLIGRISGLPVPVFNALQAFAYSWLGRYLPGRVWSSVGKVYAGARFGLSTQELALAGVLEQIFSNVAHVLVALFFLVFLFTDIVDNPAILLSVGVVLIIVGVWALQPAVLQRVVNVLLRRMGYPVLQREQFPVNREIALFVFAYGVPLLCSGCSFWLIIVALDSGPNLGFLRALGIFVIGSLVGNLFFILPAGGIGIREAALVLLLQPVIGLPSAMVASLVSRLSLALVDILFVSTIAAVARLGLVDATVAAYEEKKL